MYELLLTDEPPGSDVDTSSGSSENGPPHSPQSIDVAPKLNSTTIVEPSVARQRRESVVQPAQSVAAPGQPTGSKKEGNGLRIQFGDAVILQRYNHNVFFVRSTGTQGFGITFVELESDYSDLETVVQQNVPFPPDLGNAVFDILPGAKYTNAAKLVKLKEAEGDLDDENLFVTFLKDSVESEATINNIETARCMSMPVRYGDECRLRHRATGDFLSCHTFDGDDAGMPKLITEPDSSVTFTIDPGYKSDQIGDPLWSNQPFTFKSAESRLQIGRGNELVQRDGSEDTPCVLGHYRSVMQSEGCLLNVQVTKRYSLVGRDIIERQGRYTEIDTS